MPTKRVPAAFHSELSEYASLLRSIRTTSTLDIAPQLAKVNPLVGSSYHASGQEDSGESDIDLSDSDAVQDALVSTEDCNVMTASKRRAKDQISTRRTKRQKRKGDDDNWTRWPLLEEHCPLPEWTFDEEVMAIAEQCLRIRSSISQGSNLGKEVAVSGSKDSEGDDISGFTLSPAYLSGLTSEAASKLTSIFALLASHRPSATFTKHGRLVPLSWLDVLEVAGLAGIFDLASVPVSFAVCAPSSLSYGLGPNSTVKVVKERMETIFGPSQSEIIARMQVLEASTSALTDAEASFGHDLSIIEPPSRRRKKKKLANSVAMLVDAERQVIDYDQTSS